MIDVEIEVACAGDLDAIVKLEHHAFPAPWRREFFESELRGFGRYCLVARRRGEVIGYLFAMWIFDEMHVNKIAVDERERRKGVALALMHRCIAFALENGVRTISLEVRKSNEPAQAFYRFLDFIPSYVRPRYYPDGEAAVVMTKRLTGE